MGVTMADHYTDPVCGMTVAPEGATSKSDYNGTVYYFCSPGCKKSFDKEPEKYLREAAPAHAHGCC